MRRNQPLEPMVEVVSFTATLRCRLSGIALRGIKGDRLLFAVAIARAGVIGAAHAKNPARAASWFVYHVINRGNVRAAIFLKA
jgi:hypothetical protein